VPGENAGMVVVMSAGTGCCGGWSWCPFWTGPGPRGRWNGCPRSSPLLPRPPSGPGTEPPAAGSGPWPPGLALLAPGWWRGVWAPKRRPGPRRNRTSSCKGPAARAWHKVPATASPPTARQRSRYALIHLAFSVVGWSSACGRARATRGGSRCSRSPTRRRPRGPVSCGCSWPRSGARAEDRRRLSPGRGRSGGPAAGSSG
jgi:hypothetical protein